LKTKKLMLAERVGFAPARDEPQAKRGVTEDHPTPPTTESQMRELAERVGFEPERTF
jgi:hypothetical protein